MAYQEVGEGVRSHVGHAGIAAHVSDSNTIKPTWVGWITSQDVTLSSRAAVRRFLMVTFV